MGLSRTPVSMSISTGSKLPGCLTLLACGAIGYYIGHDTPKDPVAAYQDIRLLVNRTKERCMTSGKIDEDTFEDEKKRIGLDIKALHMTCTTSETPTENVCDRVFTVLNGSTEIENDSGDVPCSSDRP